LAEDNQKSCGIKSGICLFFQRVPMMARVKNRFSGFPILDEDRQNPLLRPRFLRWVDFTFGHFDPIEYSEGRENLEILINRDEELTVCRYSPGRVLEEYRNGSPKLYVSNGINEGALFPNPQMIRALIKIFHPQKAIEDEDIKYAYDVLATSSYFNNLFVAAYCFSKKKKKTRQSYLGYAKKRKNWNFCHL